MKIQNPFDILVQHNRSSRLLLLHQPRWHPRVHPKPILGRIEERALVVDRENLRGKFAACSEHLHQSRWHACLRPWQIIGKITEPATVLIWSEWRFSFETTFFSTIIFHLRCSGDCTVHIHRWKFHGWNRPPRLSQPQKLQKRCSISLVKAVRLWSSKLNIVFAYSRCFWASHSSSIFFSTDPFNLTGTALRLINVLLSKSHHHNFQKRFRSLAPWIPEALPKKKFLFSNLLMSLVFVFIGWTLQWGKRVFVSLGMLIVENKKQLKFACDKCNFRARGARFNYFQTLVSHNLFQMLRLHWKILLFPSWIGSIALRFCSLSPQQLVISLDFHLHFRVGLFLNFQNFWIIVQ